MKNATFLIIILLVIAGCEDEGIGPCSSIDPPCECTRFTIVDSVGNRLIGLNNQYHPDSLILINGSDSVLLYPEKNDSSMIAFSFHSWNTLDDYYLVLNSNEIDTMNLELIFRTGECFSFNEIEKFKFNGKVVSKDNGYYELMK